MLAIVIPYYKITFFEATLQSLANQTDKRFKVYIGDDASMENPASLLEKYKNTFDFKYHRFESNLGGISLVKQWERCIALIENEEWLMILGDDDVLGNSVVEEYYKNLSIVVSLDINVVRYASAQIDAKGKRTSKIFYHPQVENSIDFLFRKLKGGTRSSLSEYIFRKNTVLAVKFKEFPLAWYSDVLAVLEFSKFNNIYTINSSLILFRYSSLNISGKMDNGKVKNISSYLFFYYVIEIKQVNFSNKQMDILLDNLEKSIINHKKNLKLFTNISLFYFKNIFIKRYFRLIIKILSSRKYFNYYLNSSNKK